MAISADQHLKNTEVPDWVLLRFRQYVDSVGGKKTFMQTFNISEAYMSYMWNGKRHPPAALHEALGVKLVAQPLVYVDLQDSKYEVQ